MATARFFYHAALLQCQEKPTNEPLAVLNRHSAVVVQIALQVGKGAFYLVVRIRHSHTVLILAGEQVG